MKQLYYICLSIMENKSTVSSFSHIFHRLSLGWMNRKRNQRKHRSFFYLTLVNLTHHWPEQVTSHFGKFGSSGWCYTQTNYGNTQIWPQKRKKGLKKDLKKQRKMQFVPNNNNISLLPSLIWKNYYKTPKQHPREKEEKKIQKIRQHLYKSTIIDHWHCL